MEDRGVSAQPIGLARGTVRTTPSEASPKEQAAEMYSSEWVEDGQHSHDLGSNNSYEVLNPLRTHLT